MEVSRTAAALTSIALSVSVTACNFLSDDGWSTTKTKSTLDGMSIIATKDFSSETNPTVVRAVLTCVEERQDVTLEIQSNRAISNDGQLQASPIVFSDDNPKGRAVLRRATSGERRVNNLSGLFEPGSYNNVIEIDAARLSAFEWAQTDEPSFWRWAASTSPDREDDAVEKYIAALKQPLAAIVFQGVFQGASLALFGGGELVKAQLNDTFMEQMLQITRQVVDNARSVNAVAQLGTGAFLLDKLPLAIELYNEGGKVEILIPDNNKTVNDILTRCNGSPWFGSRNTDAPSIKEEQVAESAQVPPVAAVPEINIDTPDIPSVDVAGRYTQNEYSKPKTTAPDSRDWLSGGGSIVHLNGKWELNVCSSSQRQHGGRIIIEGDRIVFVTPFNDSTVFRVESGRVSDVGVTVIGRTPELPRETIEFTVRSSKMSFFSERVAPVMQAGPYITCN